MTKIKTPFPYIGGKSKVVQDVWKRLGPVRTYIEPFGGSLAMLWGSVPFYKGNPTREVVNDLSGLVVNAWRAIKYDPQGLVAILENNCPVMELELRARQRYLTSYDEELTSAVVADINFYDLEAAAYWISGISLYVGNSFPKDDGGRPNVRGFGAGIYAKSRRGHLLQIFKEISDRLKYVNVFCGDWTRLVSDSVLELDRGPVAVFLDPPYTGEAGRASQLYHQEDLSVGHEVFEWCLANADHPNMRIALCGFEGEYEIPETWETFSWKSQGGSQNSEKERIWFSPHCLKNQEFPEFLKQFAP